jgi:hypothetical protein
VVKRGFNPADEQLAASFHGIQLRCLVEDRVKQRLVIGGYRLGIDLL